MIHGQSCCNLYAIANGACLRDREKEIEMGDGQMNEMREWGRFREVISREYQNISVCHNRDDSVFRVPNVGRFAAIWPSVMQ